MSLMTFLKKPSVMLALGVIGFFGTNVLTARATIKFIKEKQALNRDTTLKEDIVLGVKCYGAAATAGAVSTALIFGGNKSYATAQAGLVTILLLNSFLACSYCSRVVSVNTGFLGSENGSIRRIVP